jgi:hypothetical protein
MPAECDALQPFVDVVTSATYPLARLSLVYSLTMHAAQIAPCSTRFADAVFVRMAERNP